MKIAARCSPAQMRTLVAALKHERRAVHVIEFRIAREGAAFSMDASDRERSLSYYVGARAKEMTTCLALVRHELLAFASHGAVHGAFRLTQRGRVLAEAEIARDDAIAGGASTR